MYIICVTEISLFLTTIRDHINVFVPLKILRRTNRTLHAEPFTNTQYHFLVIVESAIMHAPNYLLLDACYFCFVALRPNAGHGFFILEVSISHTTTHHCRTPLDE
jgi:hypothetical protein